jgi:hypothetical protein
MTLIIRQNDLYPNSIVWNPSHSDSCDWCNIIKLSSNCRSQTRMLLEVKLGTNWVATDEMISLLLVRGIYYHEKGQPKKYNLLLLVPKQMVHENSKKDVISLCIYLWIKDTMWHTASYLNVEYGVYMELLAAILQHNAATVYIPSLYVNIKLELHNPVFRLNNMWWFSEVKPKNVVSCNQNHNNDWFQERDSRSGKTNLLWQYSTAPNKEW